MKSLLSVAFSLKKKRNSDSKKAGASSFARFKCLYDLFTGMRIRDNDVLRGLRDGIYIGWDPFGTMCAVLGGEYSHSTVGGVGAANSERRGRLSYNISKVLGGVSGIAMNGASFGAIQAVFFVGDAIDFHCYPWIGKITDLKRKTFSYRL